jgi:uncharacterized protein
MSLSPNLEIPDQRTPEIPTPEAPERTPRRIPNLGHALLFISVAAMMLAISELLIIAIWGPPATTHAGVIQVLHPKLEIAAEAIAYAATLLTAFFLFPFAWHRPFLDGLRWRWPAARSQAARLIPLGFMLGFMSFLIDALISSAKKQPIDQFFLKPSDAWVMTIFGVFLAPVFEEICFRGFLVPAVAIAYDWLSLQRTPESHQRWQSTTTLTPLSLIFAAFVTSLLFAALHGAQVGYSWGAMLVLFCISLVLTFVRDKTQSVAASTLVHCAYNSFIFLSMIAATGGYRHLDRITK